MKWIPVTEQLPDNGVPVVLRFDSLLYQDGVFRCGTLIGHANKMWHIPFSEVDAKPTHWTLLPELDGPPNAGMEDKGHDNY